MASRLHRLGTIYSRINGLISKGHLKESDRPLWFDVYRSFPPMYEPTYKRKAPETQVKEIFYKEDALRAKIYKAIDNRLCLIDLNSDEELKFQKCFKTCQQYISEGLSEEEAVEKLKLSLSKTKEDSSASKKTSEIKDIEKLLDDIL